MKALSFLVVAGILASAPHSVLADMKAKSKMAATLKCPSCGMPMSTHKSASAPVPVKIHGKTYYCCAACASGKKAMAAMKKM